MSIGNYNDQIYSIGLQNDLKIVAAGVLYTNISECNFSLIRINSNGSIDSTFGINGIVSSTVGTGNSTAQAMNIQSDGKIVISGFASNGLNNDFATARYDTTGILDTTFGTGGTRLTSFGFNDDIAYGQDIQTDGKIVLVGTTRDSLNNTNCAILRYDIKGDLDTTFGTDGKVFTSIGNMDDFTLAGKIQTDGKILVGGYSWNGLNNDFALVRFRSNGVIDSTFGTNGIVITQIGANDDYAYAISLQPDGKIILVGSSNDGVFDDFAIVRYNINGTLDSTFGIGGIVTTDFVNDDDKSWAIVIQTDSKIIASGSSWNGSNFDFAIARYNGDLVDIVENKQVDCLTIFPNPSIDIINFEVQKINKFHNSVLSIYNAQGQLLLQQPLQNEKSEVDISFLKKGIYIIKYKDDNSTFVSKFIKE